MIAARHVLTETDPGWINSTDDLHFLADGERFLRASERDGYMRPQNEEAFTDALVKAGKRFEMKVCPMRKHGIDDQPATVHLYRAMLDFWKRRL